MNKLILFAGAVALTVGCSKPASSASNNSVAADPNRVRPVATSGETPATPASASASAPVKADGAAADRSAPVKADGAAADRSASTVREITLPAGTVLPVALETSIGSDISRVEQPVRGRLRRAVVLHGVEVLPAGTAVTGHVTAARRPGKVKGRGYVAVRFTQVDTPGPGSASITTAPVSRLAPATKEKDTVKILGPAAAGAVIGRVAGGKDAAAKGAAIGGAAGTGYVLSTRGKDARIGKGAALSVKLIKPLTVRVGS
jgi:hypothetical protein